MLVCIKTISIMQGAEWKKDRPFVCHYDMIYVQILSGNGKIFDCCRRSRTVLHLFYETLSNLDSFKKL